jgi:multidrug resistance efflux pump
MKRHFFLITLLSAMSLGADAPKTAPSTRPAGTPIVLPATVEAYEQVDLYAQVSGYLKSVNYDIGDEVAAGKDLAVIEQPELVAQLEEAKWTAVAKQKLVDAATAAVKQAEQSLQVAKSQVARYKADLDLQRVSLKRTQELYTQKAATDQQMDEAKSKAEIAEADAAIAAAKVSAAEADLASAQAAEAVANAQAKVAAAQQEKAEALNKYLRITMPFDGTVSRRLVNRGDLAQSATSGRGTALFTVQQTKKLRVRCDVPESVAAKIKPKTAASVKLSKDGEAIIAIVSRTAGALNPDTRTMRVEIDLDNESGKLLPGTYAVVTLMPAEPEKK